MKFALILLFSVAYASSAFGATPAATIVFSFSGVGSGTIGGTPFIDIPFQLIAQADTSNRTSQSYGYNIPNTSAQISLGAIGTFSITSLTRTYLNTDFSIVGLSRGVTSGLDLYSSYPSAELAAWTMLSSVGPITGTGNLLQWSNSPQVTTSGGILVFQNNRSVPNYSFTAVIVPEPTATLVMIVAIPVVIGRWRIRI